MPQATIPEMGFLRLRQILGDPKSKPPIPPIIPVGKSTWWEGVKTGRFPAPIKIGPNVTAWDAKEIQSLIEQLRTERPER